MTEQEIFEKLKEALDYKYMYDSWDWSDDVLVVMQDVDCFTHAEIRWRSIHKDSVVDKNGFATYPSEEEVLAWLPIPKYVKKDRK